MNLTKEQRQRKISALVAEHIVTNHNDLLLLLERERVTINQSTLSRDLNELGIKKQKHKGIWRYLHLAQNSSSHTAFTFSASTGSKAFLHAHSGGEQMIISTPKGYAQSIALDIEQAQEPEIMGVLYGSSTVMVIGQKGISRKRLAELIVRAVPEISQAR